MPTSEKPRIPLKKQVTIKRYVRQGYSANEIQKKMQAKNMGVRRTVLLAYVRKYKHKAPVERRERYVPTKYRRVPKPVEGKGPKGIEIYGTYRGRTRRLRRRGTGKDLFRWVRRETTSGEWDEILNIKSF